MLELEVSNLNTLNEAAVDMRALGRLIGRSRRWDTIGSLSPAHLAPMAERTEFSGLARHHLDWLSINERTSPTNFWAQK
jgi:hypothetical protein